MFQKICTFCQDLQITGHYEDWASMINFLLSLSLDKRNGERPERARIYVCDNVIKFFSSIFDKNAADNYYGIIHRLQ